MLNQKQRGVRANIFVSLSISVGIIIYGIYGNPFGFSSNSDLIDRIYIAIYASILLSISLTVAIGRIAKHRFFTPEDIDGGGLTSGTETVRCLQSELQNTLEQTVLAFMVYLLWAASMPSEWLSVIILSSFSFLIGRLLFFTGYKKGASSRALGFCLTFYPSVLMLVGCILFHVSLF